MKRVLVIAGMLMILAASVYAQQGPPVEPPARFGGFDIIVTVTAPGQGTFSITGQNPCGSIDVSGTFSIVVDKENRTWSCLVVFNEGSTVTTADGYVIDLSGEELYFTSDNAGQGRIVYSVVQYLKSLLEDA